MGMWGAESRVGVCSHLAPTPTWPWASGCLTEPCRGSREVASLPGRVTSGADLGLPSATSPISQPATWGWEAHSPRTACILGESQQWAGVQGLSEGREGVTQV